jgi:membrane protease subunit HflC
VEEIDPGREAIMERVTERSNQIAAQYGIQVLDVRIKRADLPPENAKAVFGRMDAERNRISTRYRSEGMAESEKIKAQTDRDVKVILANAYKNAQTVKGEADGKAAAIYSDAYTKYKDFYTFLKSLETLEKTLDSDTKMVLGTTGNVYEIILRKK